MKAIKWIIIKWGTAVFCKHSLCTIGDIRSSYQLMTARPPTFSVQNPFIHMVIVLVPLLLFAPPFKPPFNQTTDSQSSQKMRKSCQILMGLFLKSSDLSKEKRKTELLWIYFVMSELSLGEWRQSQELEKSQHGISYEATLSCGINEPCRVCSLAWLHKSTASNYLLFGLIILPTLNCTCCFYYV